jgi:hypothetical protein
MSSHIKITGRHLILSLFFAVFVLVFYGLAKYNPTSGIPAYSSLVVAAGTVKSVIEPEDTIDFVLAGDEHVYRYHSKAGSFNRVKDALRLAGTNTVAVLYDTDSWKPWGSDTAYYTVWDISVGQMKVRSYKNIIASWTDDNRLLYWIGGFFLLWWAWLGFCVSRHSAPNASCE